MILIIPLHFRQNYVYLYKNQFMNQEIINDYLLNDMSVEKLALKYKMGKIKIKKILLDNNIKLKTRGGQIKHVPVPFTQDLNNKIAVCKICGKEFNDVENKSGSLVEHMRLCYPNIIIPNKLFRSNYKKTNGEYWHSQFYNLIDKKEKEKLVCPICGWFTYDLINKTGSFTKHIEKEHNGIETFLKQFSDFSQLFNVHNNILLKLKEIEDDYVVCKVCGKKLKIINDIHLRTHNMSLTEYKMKYLNENIVSNSTIEKLKITYENNLKHYESGFKSTAENEIHDLIKENGFDALLNNKKILNGVEVDILIPELNIGFEYNGNYYHTEIMGKDRNYHLNKQQLAKTYGINLIHIFEDEWINKRNIVINKILHIIGKNINNKVYARNTIIGTVKRNDVYNFLEKNHIQGFSNKCKVSIGAYYNTELIGVMSFYKEKNIWVLNRFATSINHRCIGVANKLFTHFIKNMSEGLDIITFGDRNWMPDSIDNIYIKMGFKLHSTLKPDYKYFNPKISRNNRLHKFNFRKKILLRKYSDILNSNMTEAEMTKLIGCERIWDCGLYKFIYKQKGES